MIYVKPQSPIRKGDTGIYPLTTYDQIIMKDGNRFDGELVDLSNYYTKDELKAALLDLIYPVGSIYISLNSTNPSSIFGGTWEQIKGRFLLGVSSSHPVNQTGGEEKHTLTEQEMPQHTHKPLIGSDIMNYVDHGGNVGTAPGGNLQGANSVHSTGGGQPHNNMPPYLAVYMWKRTA